MMKAMDFKMEDLMPLVADLTDKYTSKDSTSVTYETARQLMEAVLYCIRAANKSEVAVVSPDMDQSELAKLLYQSGYQKILDNVMRAKSLSDKIFSTFRDYGNRSYYDTVIEGMPAFFIHYDARFCPQDHLLTLDYPLISGIGKRLGIQAIHYYLTAIWLEQFFLKELDEQYIREVLTGYYTDYEDLFVNVCSPVLRNLIGGAIAGKASSQRGFAEADFERIREFVRINIGVKEESKLESKLEEIVQVLVKHRYGDNQNLFSYLKKDLHSFAIELVNAVNNNCLHTMFVF